jgi:MFS family permease
VTADPNIQSVDTGPTVPRPSALTSGWALFILFLIYAVHGIDRNSLNVMLPAIADEFALTDSQVGLLSGLAYAVPFAIAGLPLGALVDRVNRVAMLSFLIILWSLFTGISAFASGFLTLVAARAMIGAAESATPSTSFSLISDFFQERVRPTAVGIFYAAAPLGSLVGASSAGLITAAHGWRTAFLVAAAPGFAVAVLFFFSVREPARQSRSIEVEQGGSYGGVIRAMIRDRQLSLLVAAIVLAAMVALGVSAWTPLLLVRDSGMNVREAGLLTGVAFGVGGAAGSAIGGLAARFFAAGDSRRLLLIAGLAVGAAALILEGLLFVSTPATLPIFLLLLGVATSVYYGPAFGLCLNLAPAAMRGRTMAVLLILCNILGAGLGPQVVGFLSDLFNSRGDPRPLAHALAWLAGLHIISFLLFMAARRAKPSRSSTAEAAAAGT